MQTPPKEALIVGIVAAPIVLLLASILLAEKVWEKFRSG